MADLIDIDALAEALLVSQLKSEALARNTWTMLADDERAKWRYLASTALEHLGDRLQPASDSAARWPYTEPHTIVGRWKVDIPGAGALKGVTEQDARDLAEEHGGTASFATVLLVTGGPDKGTEVLTPWRQVANV
jgi:hypothetical protein